mmetsp:Transcript_14975/g.42311  ORF Transcript_14975/g.42311 Transcript_14975/m.42311 type:complete len:206 (+) Transcript_14975:2642-3259(+)
MSFSPTETMGPADISDSLYRNAANGCSRMSNSIPGTSCESPYCNAMWLSACASPTSSCTFSTPAGNNWACPAGAMESEDSTSSSYVTRAFSYGALGVWYGSVMRMRTKPSAMACTDHSKCSVFDPVEVSGAVFLRMAVTVGGGPRTYGSLAFSSLALDPPKIRFDSDCHMPDCSSFAFSAAAAAPAAASESSPGMWNFTVSLSSA